MAGSTQMVSGLSSGIDWATMIDQLIAVDRNSVVLQENKVAAFEEKKAAWQSLNTNLSQLESAIAKLTDPDNFNLFIASLASNSSTDAADILSVSVDDDASVGTFDIIVNQTAANEKLSSTNFSSTSDALGLSGEFILGGQRVEVETTDSLNDLVSKINQANSGDAPSQVSASILTAGQDNYRIVLTSGQSGTEGIDIRDASATNVLQSLGFIDSGTEVANSTVSGALSATFTSADSSVSALLGLDGALSGTTVQIGAHSNLTLDLSQSLTQIRDSINTQAGQNVASIVSEEDDEGTTVYRLKLIGTSFSDDNNVLQVLGLLTGTHGTVAEVQQTGALSQTSAAGGGVITAATTFAQINTGSDAGNVADGDTISIVGTDHDGNAVSGSFTITAAGTSTIGDLLTQIETLYGGGVTASVDAEGKITVTDDVSGVSQLTVSLAANNEGGGTLDLGETTVATSGRTMQIQAGRDASISIDGLTVTSESNTITDVVSGVTLNLLKADSGTTVTIDVQRDGDTLGSLVNGFSGAYNTVIDWINTQMTYNSETQKPGGPLFGDSTLSSIRQGVMNLVTDTVDGASSSLNTLKSIGLELTDKGQMTFDSSTFSSALNTQFDNVVALFAARGWGSTGTLSYVDYGDNSDAGVYSVNITQAAQQASVTGSANLDDVDGLDGDETLTITDKLTGQVASIALTAGMDSDAVAAAINSELNRVYTQVLTEASGHQTTTASGGPAFISALTTLDSIDTGGDNNDLSNGDSITFSGTSRSGRAISGSFIIEDVTTDTMGGLLDAIEEAYDSKVSATIDSNGSIVLTDKQGGTSQLSISLGYSGDGSLSFDTVDETISGRHAIGVSASVDGSGNLTLTHANYGDSYGFSVAQSSNHLGFADQELLGTDVAGTINGQAATGKGQLLSGDEGSAGVDGLTLKYSGTTTGAVGSMTFRLGFAGEMERLLAAYTDPYTGYIDAKNDGFEDSISSLNDNIERMDARLDLKREMMITQFIAMEKMLGQLQNQQSWLSAQLGSM